VNSEAIHYILSSLITLTTKQSIH